MAIWGISGYSTVGKDETAKIIQKLTGYEIKRWSGKLKEVASVLLGVPAERFEDQSFKASQLGEEWGHMTVREFLQRIGTNAIREQLHPNAWVNAIMSEYTTRSNWVFADTRFKNEAQAIKERGGIIIRINRKGVGPINDHPSEIELDDWEFDHIIENNGSIDELVEQVKLIL